LFIITLGIFSGGFLATKFGGKTIFLIGIAATSTLTLVTPFLAKSGTGFLITTRILEGLFEVCLNFFDMCHPSGA
jgi:MFS family permease